MSKIGTKNKPAIIKFGPASKQEEILSVINKYDIQFIAGFEDEEDISDLRTLISKEDFMSIANPDAPSNKAKNFVQSLFGKAQSRNAPCPCGSGKQYKRCCGK
jgi:uncharacterized protein YecA (UPF0149 family)